MHDERFVVYIEANFNLSNVLQEANARMIEGEKVQKVKDREQILIKEMPSEKQAEK